MNNKIIIASDHGGYELKEKIKNVLDAYEVIDVGTHNEKMADFPFFAAKACNLVLKHNAKGILICGTGIGMSVASNKIKGIVAALCGDEYTAKMSREHNDSNVLCLAGRILEPEKAGDIVRTWLQANFIGGRYIRRKRQVERLEDESIRISASILGANKDKLQEEVESIQDYVNSIHVDVMDGKFVVDKCFESMPKIRTNLPINVHLMVEKPKEYIDRFIGSAETIIFHYESDAGVHEMIDILRNKGISCGISVNPGTDIENIYPYLDMLDAVLVMTVNPGKGGQAFIEDSVQKIAKLKEEIGLRPVDIMVDGGINEKTSRKVIDAGANTLVSGSYIFNSENRKEVIISLKR